MGSWVPKGYPGSLDPLELGGFLERDEVQLVGKNYKYEFKERRGEMREGLPWSSHEAAAALDWLAYRHFKEA